MKLLIPLAIISSTLVAHAKDVRFEDCPPGVKSTITANLEGGRIDDIDRVQINGVTRYVVEIDGPAGRDITFRLTSAGRVVLSSEDVNLNECPAAVRQSIRKLLQENWANWRIDDIDREVSGKSVSFRVDFDRGETRDLEFLISNKGKVLKRTVDKTDD